jgi:hypothetical protein
MHYTFVSVSYLHITIDPTEQEPEELQEPTQVEETNPEQEQGKPQCIWPSSLNFIYLYLSIMILACALSCTSWMDVVVALDLLFDPPLLIIWLKIGR